MKTLAKILLLAAFVAGLATLAIADNVATSTVTITFSEIAELETTGTPGTLTITAPTAGSLPAPETDDGTTMAWTSNVVSGTRKITGSIDTVFSGIDLYATVAASGGTGTFGTSAGEQMLVTAPAADFVTGIGNGYISNQKITFRANVTSMVTPYTDTPQTVTWTLTDDA